jgi:GGDEF domain-containing protein
VEAASTERSWRPSHAAAHVVATAGVLLALGLLAGRDTPRVALVVALTALLCGAVAAVFDGLLGLFVGLVAAVAVVFAHRTWGGWDLGSVAEVLLVVALGWSAGMTGAFVRRTARHLSTPPHGAVVPSLHTLGLLDAASARARIDEELRRVAGTDRPLSVALVRIEHLGDGDEEVERLVAKAVARVVEASSRDTDVPFALGDDLVGVVLPDTDEGGAWRVLGALVGDALATSVADRRHGARRPLRDLVALHAVFVCADETTHTADHLLGPGRERAEAMTRVGPA